VSRVVAPTSPTRTQGARGRYETLLSQASAGTNCEPTSAVGTEKLSPARSRTGVPDSRFLCANWGGMAECWVAGKNYGSRAATAEFPNSLLRRRPGLTPSPRSPTPTTPKDAVVGGLGCAAVSFAIRPVQSTKQNDFRPRHSL